MCGQSIKIRLSLSCCMLALTLMSTQTIAQTSSSYTTRNDPARWTQEDVTRQQKLSTATKEAIAAQQQSIDECRKLPIAERTVCVANAHAAYRNDLAAIRLEFGR